MMQAQPIWLSLLLPVYNVAPYLDDCLNSILPQIAAIGGGVEIILLDDCSTDSSAQICAAWYDAYPDSIQFIAHPDNRGPSAARNTMLEAAAGDYLWFIDSDDMLMPGALSALRNIIAEDAPDVVLCDFHKGNGRRIPSFVGLANLLIDDREALVRGVFASGKMFPWLKITRRSLWDDDLRFPVGRFFEDVTTTPLLMLRGNSHVYSGQTWIYYRQRPGSTMAQTKSRVNGFNVAKNMDLAQAMAGYKHALAQAIPQASAELDYHVSYFCGKQFTNIAWRLVRTRPPGTSWREIAAVAAQYRDMLEAGAPMDFHALNREIFRRGRLVRFVILRSFLKLADMQSPQMQQKTSPKPLL